jgi:hypothetical protein
MPPRPTPGAVAAVDFLDIRAALFCSIPQQSYNVTVIAASDLGIGHGAGFGEKLGALACPHSHGSDAVFARDVIYLGWLVDRSQNHRADR